MEALSRTVLVHFLTSVVQVEVLLCVSFKVCGPLALSAACFLVATNLMPLWRGGSDLGSAKRATKAMRTIEDTLTIKPRRHDGVEFRNGSSKLVS